MKLLLERAKAQLHTPHNLCGELLVMSIIDLWDLVFSKVDRVKLQS